jgi:hypothetical protein
MFAYVAFNVVAALLAMLVLKPLRRAFIARSGAPAGVATPAADPALRRA